MYAFNQKERLMNYLLDGNCSISNNLAENSIRPFTIGRKNWQFSGSPADAAASAGIYSVIETAKANGINPNKYIQFILSDIPGSAFIEYPEFWKSICLGIHSYSKYADSHFPNYSNMLLRI